MSTEAHRRNVERVLSVLPPGEELQGVFSVIDPDGDLPPRRLRPRPFPDYDRARVKVGRVLFWPLKLLLGFTRGTMPEVSAGDPAQRMKHARYNSRSFGSWESYGKQFLLAVFPYTDTMCRTVVAVTTSGLAFVYLQGPSSENGPVRIGVILPRESLSWVRKRKKDKHDTEYQFGFIDGSWGTAACLQPDSVKRLFPVLPQTHPIPQAVWGPQPR